MPLSRRELLAAASAAALLGQSARSLLAQEKGAGPSAKEVNFGFGLVTYLWGSDLDLPSLLDVCRKSGLAGVELRTTHKHGVEPSLTAEQRVEVRKQFEDSGITLVGIGSDERFDNPDPEVVKKAIERAKEFVRLSHDVGGSGVKVKPDKFYDNVPREKTIAQIANALNELGEYAAGFGQQIRLEVHGGCSELPVIKQIMDRAKDSNVAICWNSNVTDLKGDGLEANFKLVRDRFGQTLHVRSFKANDYPWDKLIKLLVSSEYAGWVLLEAGGDPPKDRVEALAEQVEMFHKFVEDATA
jgi:sugar phosphate isomerase/epimerase